jgi:predicted membrane protein
MPLITVVITLLVVGVLLWLINTYAAPVTDAKIIKLINVFVIIVCVIWILQIFGVWGYLTNVRVR